MLLIDVDHHIVGVPSACGDTFDFRDGDSFPSKTSRFWIEAIEFNIPTLSLGNFCRNKAIRRAET